MRSLILLLFITAVACQSCADTCSQFVSKDACLSSTCCLWCRFGNGTCMDPSIQMCPAHLLDTPCTVHAEELKVALVVCISAISVILIGIALLFLYLCLPSPCMMRHYSPMVDHV